jgi:hypothetical protein
VLKKRSIVLYLKEYDRYVIHGIYMREGAGFPKLIEIGDVMAELYRVSINNTPFYVVAKRTA